MANESKLCQFWGAQPDNKEAKYTFKLPNGSEIHICEIHADEYASKYPDAVRTDIAS